MTNEVKQSLNIFQRMSKITEEISTVSKNLEVGYGSSKYKAVGEADVLRAVKPIEQKNGVYSYPFSREVIESGVLTNIRSDGKEVKQQYLRIATVYRFVNVEKPEEYIDITTYGDGVDSQDKAPGKAMTYGDKYALLKAYKIQTGDDPDQNASEPLGSKEAARSEGNDELERMKSIGKILGWLNKSPEKKESYVTWLNGNMDKKFPDKKHESITEYTTQEAAFAVILIENAEARKKA
jgi:hypothetical protein